MATFTLDKTFASLPATTRGKFIVINGDPKGKNFLYCNGCQVIIRNIEDTSISDVYTEHNKDTTVAKYAPSGYYIASGDVTGKVKIWDSTSEDHLLKYEYPVIGGAIKDIDWTFDSKRLCAVGEGRETFGRVFLWDSGSSVGEIMGHSKAINNCAFKPDRPLRLATVGEDFCTVFYEGPPFKFKCSKSDHTNFVNCVRYAPDGGIFITGGADGKLLVYDGKTSEFIFELGGDTQAHKGGVYAISFKEDSKKLLSVSGDKTAKIWDLESKTCETEFVMGTQMNDMQVGCLWQKDIILTVSLSSYLNFLDPSNPSKPKKIVKGHNKPIKAMAITPDGSTIYSASNSGRMISWDAATGDCEDFKGKGHTNQVSGMVLDGEFLVTVGMDDTIRYSNPSTLELGDGIKLDAQPQAVDSKNGIAVIACNTEVVVMEAPGRKLSTLSKIHALSVSIHPSGTEVAIGTMSSLNIFNLKDGHLSETKKFPLPGEVHNVEYSPDGAWLLASSGKTLALYDHSSWKEILEGWGSQHTAKVTSVKWAPNSEKFVTGSVDAHMILWQHGKFTGQKPNVKAHPKSLVYQVGWLDNTHVVTAGQDSNIKLWTISD